MAVYYFDASAVVKYYVTEPGSTWVRQLIEARDAESDQARRRQLLASYQHTVTFVCSDHTLLTAAQAERLRTENPFNHISPRDALENSG